MDNSKGSGVRKLILLLILVAVLAGAGLLLTRTGPAPAITIEPAAKVIGRKTPVTIRITEPERGIGPVHVELLQGDVVQRLAESNNAMPSMWALWRKGKTAEEIRVDVGKDAVKDLKAGSAIIRVTAERVPALLRRPGPVVTQVELPVRLVPPTVQVLSTFTYVSQGGAEAVVYRTGDTATRDGVRAGTRFFPGYPLPGGGPHDRFALFSVPYDMDDVSSVKVIAADEAGNETEVRFIDKFFAKPLRRDTITLTDEFMQKVTAEIMSQTPDLADKGSVLENYLQINRDLRKKNNAFLVGLTAKTQHAFLWREPFLPMVNTAIKASFADRRSYVYQARNVDEQDHLGLDMASTRADKVPAANDGVVIFAAYLGIYGNCVVLDHGYGLQTLYGHLSSMDVKEGDKVARGQTLGHSGATGLAGGDHLHFAVMLDGLPVSPIEWFDSKWIHDRLKLKLGNALPFGT
ncbi:MAG TPA: M23 family metallopeptidase [Burkholderiales bacterium]|nr:M23 family metallopeptidase [Burkholderiales bacterium]